MPEDKIIIEGVQQNNISIEPVTQVKVERNNTSIYSRYHSSEIDQSEKILKNAIRMTWVGFAILAICVVMVFKGAVGEAVITGVSGLVLEVISGTIYVLVDKSSKSKYQYFKKLSEDEVDRKIIGMVEKCENGPHKEELLKALVSNWCERMLCREQSISNNIDE